jgi:ATP-dependent Clp protease ATP-binding subunit ClpC
MPLTVSLLAREVSQSKRDRGAVTLLYCFMQLAPGAKRIFLLAINEASRLGQAQVEPHHLLLGLARTGDDMSQELFNIGLPLERVRGLIRLRASISQEGSPFYSDRTRRIVTLAASLADHGVVETRHLLLALLRDPETLAYQLLATSGELDRLEMLLNLR